MFSNISSVQQRKDRVIISQQDIGAYGRLDKDPGSFFGNEFYWRAFYFIGIIKGLLTWIGYSTEARFSSLEIQLESTLREIGWQPQDILALGITMQQSASDLAQKKFISADFVFQVAFHLVEAVWKTDGLSQAGIALSECYQQYESVNTTNSESNKIITKLNQQFLLHHRATRKVKYMVEHNQVGSLEFLLTNTLILPNVDHVDHQCLKAIDIEVQRLCNGMGLIYLAAARGHLAVIELLWNSGLCNINLRCPIEIDSSSHTTSTDSSALECAVKRGHVEVVKGLLAKQVVNYDLNHLKSLLRDQPHTNELLNYFNGIVVVTACARALKSLRLLKFQLQREFSQQNYTTLNALAKLKNKQAAVLYHQCPEVVNDAALHFIQALIAIFKAEHQVIATNEVNTSSFIDWVLHVCNHVGTDYLELKNILVEYIFHGAKFIGLSLDAIFTSGLSFAIVSIIITRTGYIAKGIGKYFFNTNNALYHSSIRKINDQLSLLVGKFEAFQIQAQPIPYKINQLIESAEQSRRVIRAMR